MSTSRWLGKEWLPPTGCLLAFAGAPKESLLSLVDDSPRPILLAVPETGLSREEVAELQRRGVNVFGEEEAPRIAQRLLECTESGQLVALMDEIRSDPDHAVHPPNPVFQKVFEAYSGPVCPAWIDLLWILLLRRWALESAAPKESSLIHIGPPRSVPTLSLDWLVKSWYDLGERSLSSRPEIEGNLALACFLALREARSRAVLTDGFQESRTLSGAKLLALGLRLARWLRRSVPEPRVGLVLPHGIGAAAANLACLFAGKAPVNLNFTAGRTMNTVAIRNAGLRTILTAEAIQAKLGDFPWTDRTVDLRKLLSGFSRLSLLRDLFLTSYLPTRLALRVTGIPLSGGNREASLLFTSGTAGDPKGVSLSHRNLLANVGQIEAILGQIQVERVLACLPVFHSFGATATLWWPLMGGPHAITYVSPMEAEKLAQLIETHRIDLLITAPTFLRTLLRKAERNQMRSLRLVIVGSERLPQALRAEFEAKFGTPVCEGYGLTEASPVVSTNLMDLRYPVDSSAYRARNRPGTVGRIAPGISVRVRHPDTGADLSLSERGILCFRGANIFRGYLDDPLRTQGALSEGWLLSGDVGRVDEAGFLQIEGRISRFSKLAGEMVPHGTVEETILRSFGPELGEGFEVAVVGIPHGKRGEELVLFSNRPLTTSSLRRKFVAQGLSSLWSPRKVIVRPEIPKTPLGKVDFRSLREIALTEEE
ncbi:AMP-binding protein [Methylacidimicrobium tartarophylax]|uniref:Acyl-[acyl-carrier-protein]-phospholipid O-acyltransferase / long-chain-fatty-acid--[acyl-carrier-protein] ligase n=1 Tax=Methylacidimicrobium tartarophylax TaxID=1041768 RepID=A0A5E6MDI8_9BACT|nr:AMP-binding protein [Methylacidimicrobium tartarophylax]VVM06396.1 acyl-[acyl-carrier-protein]-phospholipid O-acyltransferase / long-chain-fatty-acid--[acyl-carrier-protein] ligase [Methylacidimicrobium tartarophylax]